jgi:hypothetical protein
MTTKLTLSVDDEIVKQAKRIAAAQGVSLSKLVEGFLRNLSSEHVSDDEMNPVLKKLSGSIHVPADFDYRKELEEALVDKYSR